MSADLTPYVFKAVRTALTADATLAPLIGDRVYSDWGFDDTAPAIRLSAPVIEKHEEDCGEGRRIDLRVHVFCKSGRFDLSTLAGRVAEVLDQADLALDQGALQEIDYRQTLNTRDPDDPQLLMAVAQFDVIAITPV